MTRSHSLSGNALQYRHVMVVDDDLLVRQMFRRLLEGVYQITECDNGADAVRIATQTPCDLVLLDISMPRHDGYQTCRELKALPLIEPPQVIMVSAKSETSEQAEAFNCGADDYLIKPVDPAELRSRVNLHFRLRISQATTASLQREVDRHHAALKRAAVERNRQILALQDIAVFTLAKVAESRDHETGQHVLRLREYAQEIARELAKNGPYATEIDSDFLADLHRSSPLHDIGKVGIPDAILLKPGKLTDEEFKMMKRHTSIGGNILHEAVMKSHGGGFLTMAAMIAHFHHERWDGRGYPAGLIGAEIPLAARIVSVADVYDALTSHRPYKEAWPNELARQAIVGGAGTQFDPIVVAAFERSFDKIAEIQEKNQDHDAVAIGAMAFLDECDPLLLEACAM